MSFLLYLYLLNVGVSFAIRTITGANIVSKFGKRGYRVNLPAYVDYLEIMNVDEKKVNLFHPTKSLFFSTKKFVDSKCYEPSEEEIKLLASMEIIVPLSHRKREEIDNIFKTELAGLEVGFYNDYIFEKLDAIYSDIKKETKEEKINKLSKSAQRLLTAMRFNKHLSENKKDKVTCYQNMLSSILASKTDEDKINQTKTKEERKVAIRQELKKEETPTIKRITIEGNSEDIKVSGFDGENPQYNVPKGFSVVDTGNEVRITKKDTGYNNFAVTGKTRVSVSVNSSVTINTINSSFYSSSDDNNSISIKLCKDNKYALSLKTTSGDIRVDDLDTENVDIRANSGDVTLVDLNASSLTAITSSGDIDMIDVNSNEYQIQTTSGDADLDMPESIDDYAISANTTSGDILGLNIAAYRPKQKAKRLNAGSISGDIKFRFNR